MSYDDGRPGRYVGASPFALLLRGLSHIASEAVSRNAGPARKRQSDDPPPGKRKPDRRRLPPNLWPLVERQSPGGDFAHLMDGTDVRPPAGPFAHLCRPRRFGRW